MKHILHINGMHCKSCELLIKNKLNEVNGCEVIRISHKTGICEITYNQKDISTLESIINNEGYTIWEDNNTVPTSADQRIEKIIRLILAAVLIFILTKLDISNLIPKYDKLSLGVSFIVGLVASVSTCLAITWGIIMGYNESVQTTHPLYTQIKFQLGRIIAFVVGWWILGLVGWELSWSLWFNALFSILVWIILFYIWLQLLWVVPNITKWWFHLPSWLSQTIFNLKNPKYAPIVGALTFLLPCGFTQSMQLFALQSGNMVTGASIMGIFALGTMPVLLGLWWGTKYIKDKLTMINPLIASLLVVFGIYTIYNWTVLTVASTGNSWSSYIATTDTSQNLQTIQVGHNGRTFEPKSILLKAWNKYKLVVTPSSDGVWCFYALAFGGKQYPIKKWQSFELLVDASQNKTIPLVCAAMGMRMGEVVIQ